MGQVFVDFINRHSLIAPNERPTGAALEGYAVSGGQRGGLQVGNMPIDEQNIPISQLLLVMPIHVFKHLLGTTIEKIAIERKVIGEDDLGRAVDVRLFSKQQAHGSVVIIAAAVIKVTAAEMVINRGRAGGVISRRRAIVAWTIKYHGDAGVVG